MALLGKIRNQFGWVMMGLVILGVVGFLFMDVSSIGRGGMGAQQRVVAKINGEEVLREDFQQYIDNYGNSASSQEEVRNQAWNDLLRNVIFRQQATKAGLVISEQELSNLFTGDDISMSTLVRQQFANQSTGEIDRTMIKERRKQYFSIKEKDRSEVAEQELQYFQAWESLERTVLSDRLKSKYMGMIEKSIYAPSWMTNMEYNRNSQTFNFSFVNVLYTDVPNSEVKVSDEEMTKYIKEHAKQYEREANVSIDYVIFDVNATKEDSATYRKDMEAAAADFASKTSSKEDSIFIQNERGTLEPTFYTAKTWSDKIITDTLFAADKGAVIGPYEDGTGNIKVVKILESKNMPDSIKVRHIFKRVNQRDISSLQQNYVELDSLRKLLVNGEASFDSLAFKHSTDGTRDKGGDLGYRGRGDAFGANFEAYIFDVGEKDSFKIIQTQEGLHLVQIRAYKYPAQTVRGIRVGVLTKAIIPSDKTADQIEAQASELMASNRTVEELRKAAKAAKLRIGTASTLTVNAYTLGQDVRGGIAAEIIKWGHKEAKAGEVAGRVYPITDPQGNFISKIIVPAVVSKAGKGVANISDNAVKAEVEKILRNKKKAAIIAKKLSDVNTLDGVVQKYSNAKIKTASNVRYDAPFVQEFGGSEPKVIAAINLLEADKVSKPIAGNLGVYVIQLQSKNTPTMPDVKIARRSVMNSLIPRSPMNPTGYQDIVRDAIKDKIKIKDNRSDIY